MIVGKNINGNFDSKQISPLEVTVTPRKSIQHLMLNDFTRGTTVAQWLRYCASNRKVAGLIPDGASGIFH
jgi:hypothetical protein